MPSHELSVRTGRGWTILDTAGIQDAPGAHDIGVPLGIAEGTIMLVILRAAERWAPNDETSTAVTAIIGREGQMLVELSDGSTQRLDAGRDWSAGPERSVAGVVNLGIGLAKALVIAG